MKLHDYFADFLANTVNLSQKRLDTLTGRIGAIETATPRRRRARVGARRPDPAGLLRAPHDHQPVNGHEYDADVLLPIDEQPGWQPKDYVNELYGLSSATAPTRGRSSRRSRCVVVDYADPFHVDVVPYVARAGAHLHHEPERRTSGS